MADVVEIECTVSTHPEIQCSASEDGVITIQTKTDSITIQLQQTLNKKRVPIKSIKQQPVRTAESSSGCSTRPTIFSFAVNSGQEDTLGDNHSDGGQIDTNGNNTGRTNGSISRKEPLSDEELEEVCQQLALKILKRWNSKKHKVKKSLDALCIDWPDLFGCPSYTSLGQWSYKALETSEKFEGLQRRFHQLNLASWWNGGLERGGAISIRVKNRMISELEPRFGELDSKAKDAKRRQIDRYVQQGEIISLLCTQIPGLLFTASDHITTSEYDMLWRNKDRPSVLRLGWIREEQILESKVYTESVLMIFGQISQFLTFNRQLAPSPKVSSAGSPSTTEPESGTSATSLCQPVTARSFELPSFYNTSVYSRPPFESSIEASTNSTKRQKTSRHAMSQLEASRSTSQENNQISSALTSRASFADTHGEYQTPDITMAADVLRSLQQNNRSCKGPAAARLPTPDTSELGDALRGVSGASTEGCPALCEDSAASVMRSCHPPASGASRLEPNGQRFHRRPDMLQVRQASDSTLDVLAPVDRVVGVDALEPQADDLFLSDFMQEYGSFRV